MPLPVRESQPWHDPAAVPHIRIRDLVKRFAGHVAVAGVSLDIHRGELFALLGGSGCGKTTLLRMLAGFVQPDAGTITLGGKDILALPPYERPVNMMFQSYALFPHMSVWDNVAFGLRRDGAAKEEIARRVDEVLDLVQMRELGRRRPAQLSGGQRQRVALARSIVKRPEVLLLDEPLSALDKKLREATQFELVTIQEQVGITFVMVTHDQEEAMSMATRIAVMNEGKIVQVGTPTEIYEAPETRFVADFIGRVNLFDGVVAERFADHAAIDCPEVGQRLVAGGPVAAGPGEAFCLAVRPEKIRLLPAGEAAGTPNALAGTVRDIAYLGDARIYHVALDGGKLIKVTLANGGGAAPPFARGAAVTLAWAPAAGVAVRP